MPSMMKIEMPYELFFQIQSALCNAKGFAQNHKEQCEPDGKLYQHFQKEEEKADQCLNAWYEFWNADVEKKLATDWERIEV